MRRRGLGEGCEGVAVALISHQTVKLGRGKHESPAHGVCVMELASMLSGESFSDHPTTVCPIIAAFLRSYNDCIDARRRQDLYPYAAKIVDSRVPRRFPRNSRRFESETP